MNNVYGKKILFQQASIIERCKGIKNDILIYILVF